MVETIFILDEHLKTSKALTVNGKNNFFDDCYSMDLSTGVESYEFSTNVQDLDEKHYVMFYYHDQFKLFQITEIEQEHSEGKIITYCYGESACLELLNGVVRAFNGPFNCIEFLQHVLEGTSWSIGNYSSSLANKVIEVDVSKTTQKWSCIQDYMSEYGYELNTRVLYENGHVTRKVIDVYEEGQLGKVTYKRFEYGRNVEGIVKKKDLYEWCTALIIDSDADVSDVEFEKGAYVKPKGSDVIMANYENNLYNLGRSFVYANFEDKSPSGEEAVENAYNELKRRATPYFDYECTTILTYEEYDEISLGDTVYVVDHTFRPMVTLEARVGKLEISFTDRNDCKCNLTNYKEVKSRIKTELTGTVTEIIESYFPITEDKIAGEAINSEHLKEEVYELIRTNYIKAEIGEFEKVIVDTFIAKEAYVKDLNATNGRFETLETKDAEIENLIATKASIEQLEVIDAKIENLDVGDLTAVNAEIVNLKAKDVEIENLVATKADIEQLEVIDAKIENLDVGDLSAIKADITNLEAKDADIENLVAGKADIEDLEAIDAKIKDLDTEGLTAIRADIDELQAATADIGLLSADVADIKTLMSGTSSSGSIQTIHLTAANTVIEDALIKDAAIANLDAGKLTAGSIDTNKISLASSDGSMTLSGSLQQFKDENGQVRIQIGKDGNGKFSFALVNSSGTGTLIDERGVNDLGIKNGVIRNDHLSDGAAITGNKLHIGSVIETINSIDNSSGVNIVGIKSSKIIFDDTNQILDVALKEIKDTTTVNKQNITMLNTRVTTQQGQIETLIDQTTIENENGSTTNIKDAFSSLEQTVNGFDTRVGSLETGYSSINNQIQSVSSRQSSLEQDVSGFKINVSNTYVSKDTLDSEIKTLEDALEHTAQELNAKIDNVDIEISEDEILSIVSSSYYSKTEVDNNIFNSVESAKDSLESDFKSDMDSLKSDIEENYANREETENIIKEESSSQMSQTSEMIEMKFTESKEYTEEVQGELMKYKEEVSTNIRFSTAGIELGRSGSPFKTVLDNNSLAFYEDGFAVAYINNNKMNITNAQINDELEVGNFSWINANGHLRLRKE